MSKIRQIKRKEFYACRTKIMELEEYIPFIGITKVVREIPYCLSEEELMQEVSEFVAENASEVISINTVFQDNHFGKKLMVYYYEK